MPMKMRWIGGVIVVLSACAPHGASTDPQAVGSGKADGRVAQARQSAAELRAEADNLAILLQQGGMSAIVCERADGKYQLRVSRGVSDNTSLVVDGDYSYGTNEIQEMFARSSLLINFGEEGNYHLVIPNYAWQLFNYDHEGAEVVADESMRVIGAVFSEQETLDQLSCRVER